MTNISTFIERYFKSPPILFRAYKSQVYGINFYTDIYEIAEFKSKIKTNEKNTTVKPSQDYYVEWLMRLNIINSVDDPVWVFSVPIFPFSTLVLEAHYWKQPDLLFRLVINTMDSFLWLIFEIKKFTLEENDMYMIEEVDEWGKLAPSNVSFIAAKIAESVANSWIRKVD